MSKVLYQVKLRGGLKKGLAQRDLVNEVVLDYAKTNPASTLAELQRAFPLSVQKKLEIVVDEAEAQRLNASRKQYSIFRGVKMSCGSVVSVCNQWGAANIDNFLTHAKQLGYQIGLDGEALSEPPQPVAAPAKAPARPEKQNAAPLYPMQAMNEFWGAHKGKAALMHSTIFFILKDDDDKNSIYAYDVNGNAGARVFTERKVLNTWLDGAWKGNAVQHLYVWNNKLFLGGRGGIISWDGVSDSSALISSQGTSHGNYWFMSCGFAVRREYRAVVAINLATGESTKITGENEYSFGSENHPVIINDHIYICPPRNGGDIYRIPLSNLAVHQFFPKDSYGELFPIYRGAVTRKSYMPVLAAKGDVLMMGKWSGACVNLYALSDKTLRNKDTCYEVGDTGTWAQYDGYLVVNKYYKDKTAHLYDIEKAEYLGNVDPIYADTVGAFLVGDTYCILGNKTTVKNVIYKVPKDRMFKADTKLKDYAQPLF